METFSPISVTLDAISKKLNENFGNEYTIYTENAKQGLNRPCFFVKLLKASNTKDRDSEYRRENQYCIHFFPKNTNEPLAECHQMLDSLYLALEYIEVDSNPIRGVGMLGEVHDETLQFYVNFNMRVRKTYDPVLMEHLETIEFRTK